MIRQAISCDICANEKKQTNHWFVAYEQGGELRVSGWNSRNRLRPGSKHLCGQTCLHKLIDEYIAKLISVKAHGAAPGAAEMHEQAVGVDTSLTSRAAYVELESSARLITPATPAQVNALASQPAAAASLRPQPGLVTMPVKSHTESFVQQQEEPRFVSRNWRAEAWERERERELRAIEHRPDISARRRSSA